MKKRFSFSKSALGEGAKIVTDKRTGVQYLFVYSGYAGGLTLLVDGDGKPMINREAMEEE